MKYNKDKELCPNCKDSLKIHNNEQLQQCVLGELAKINRKSSDLGETND